MAQFRFEASNERVLLPDEAAPSAHTDRQEFDETGRNAGRVPVGSTKVGWTLRDSQNRVKVGFAFRINPQGLTRVTGSRAQLQSTKGGHYVDDFGPGAGSITLRQLVAEGKTIKGGNYYTGREDVQRFLQTIYLPATNGIGRKKYRVFFHDHHFERGFEERVYFPPNSLTIDRSVDLHHLWRVELQMVSLEKYPYAEVEVETSEPRVRQGRRHVVKRGQTFESLIRKVAGPKSTPSQRKRAREKLLKLNPFLRSRRKLPNGTVGKPMRVYPGEVIRLPA